MTLSRSWRRLLLTVHIGTSVAWLGVAYVALALALVGRFSAVPLRQRAAYVVLDFLDLAAWLPLGLLAVGSGVILGLGTRWGLLRHLWVAVKLVGGLAVLIAPLLAKSPNVDRALAAVLAGGGPGPVADRILIPSVLSVVVLTVSTVLSTYKPWGRIGGDRGGSAVDRRARVDRVAKVRQVDDVVG